MQDMCFFFIFLRVGKDICLQTDLFCYFAAFVIDRGEGVLHPYPDIEVFLIFGVRILQF